MQHNRLMRRFAVYCILFVFTAMGIMLYYSANKIIVVADVAQDEVVQASGGDAAGEAAVIDKNQIYIDRNSQNTNYFCIPMPESVKAEEVTVENHYMDQELWVSITPKEMADQGQFYESHGVYGNCENVLNGHFDVEKKRICLRFALTDVYEYQSIFENNTLYIEFMSPKEAYDKIVVIDPAYGAEDSGIVKDTVEGKTITLDIAKALKEKLDETDIKVYYTRMDDSNPADSSRVRLAAATKADMLIRIEVGGADSTKVYGTETVYNSRFFIPGFGSVELADLLEREVVTAISGKANGLLEATEADVVISEATIPAAAVKVGYLTNGQEYILLQRQDYIERIADGIYQAILKAYE
ncbi:MAG: N-acetylmuramoyl-L-alanine amidase [Lachnospiraceae bacterium]|nr:N-acetylmuramoyl-L-alanine amidase [Lachnospiraceae bacterium]